MNTGLWCSRLPLSVCFGRKLVVLFLCLAAVHANGANTLTLVVNAANEKVVLDQANNSIWYWDLSFFANQNYNTQLSGIQQLNATTYFDTGGWHLASEAEMRQLWRFDSAAIQQAFHPSHERYEGSYEWHYWSGRFESSGEAIHAESETAWGNFVFGPFSYAWPSVGYLSDDSGYQERGAFVVTSIPEPSAGILCGIGCLVILGARRFIGGRSA